MNRMGNCKLKDVDNITAKPRNGLSRSKTIYDASNWTWTMYSLGACYEFALLLSSRARSSKSPRSFDASPSVSNVTPWAVQTRYEGIGW